MARHSRRNFLKHAAAAALVGSHAASRASAAEKPPGMKYAMCNEAFEGWPQGKIFRFLAECGYAGVEIAPFTIHTDVTKIPPQRRTQLRKPADEAGIREGDVILEVNGEKMRNNSVLRNAFAFMNPGTKVKVELFRDKKEKTVTVEVGTYPEDREASVIAKELLGKLGMDVQELTPELARRLDYEPGSGVLVTSIENGGPAQQAGIHEGCLILSVNREQVTEVDELWDKLGEASKRDMLLLKVQNSEYVWYVPVRIN